MERRIVYLTRLTRVPLLGADGAEVGRVADAVVDLGSKPPRVNGFVVAVQRRRVFVGIGRIGEIGSDGARLRRGSVNMRQFALRQGERLLAGELIGKRFKRGAGGGHRPGRGARADGWEIATVALAGRRMPGLRRAPEMIDWTEAGELFASERPVDRQAAELGGLHPAEMASAIRRLPLSRRRVLAAELEDDRFADLLEEMSEDEQVRLIEGLGIDRLARVLDEMEADDAADLLGEFPAGRQAELLHAMDPEEAEPVRRLLNYQPDTAGGLMTPEPVILAPDDTVAEALARVRDPTCRCPWRPRCSCAAPAGDPDRALHRHSRHPAAAARGAQQAARPLHRRGRRAGAGDLSDREVAGAARRLRRRVAGGHRRGRTSRRRGDDRRRPGPVLPGDWRLA